MNPRLRRLQADYEEVRATFSGHAHVHVEPLGLQRPPDAYRVTFNLRGLELQGSTPVPRQIHVVHVHLPRNYPSDKPHCVPETRLFHPNVGEYFCIADQWSAGETIVDVIVKLGDMIQWRVYNPRSPLSSPAAEWALEQERRNPQLFPVGDVDLGVADFDLAISAGAGDDLVALRPGAEQETPWS